MLVHPPLRITEIRPIMTEYRDKAEKRRSTYDLGSYIHFLESRPDQWIDIYNTGDENPRAIGTFAAWHDFLREIFESWNPKLDERIPFDVNKLRFWRVTPLDNADESLIAKLRSRA